ncbi:MAG: cupredoxin domain-containing protein [Thermoanaerobaculia bacterium]
MKKIASIVVALSLAATAAFAAAPKKAAPAVRTIDIKISGGDYIPNVVKVKKGEKVRLNFIRDNKPTCGDIVVIPALKIKKAIPVNQPTAIDIQPTKAGTMKITCGMDMFDGKIVVTD